MIDMDRQAGQRYLDIAIELLGQLRTAQWPAMEQAAQLIADSLRRERPIHIFGTGHSHILAEEAYYRAGGLVQISPILFEGLMLHGSAPLSTSLERLPGLAAALLLDHPMQSGDVLIVASNSGSNTTTVEFVEQALAQGVRVVAITSVRHATSTEARAKSDRARLHEVANVVIDNGGLVGDAAVTIEGFAKKVAPTSTVVGAAILNAVIAQAIELLVADGITPQVYTSSNMSGGDDANAPWAGKVLP